MKGIILASVGLALSLPGFAVDKVGTSAAPLAPPPDGIAYVAGSSQKVCQLTGEIDHELHRPTVNETVKRFWLIEADLGYSLGRCVILHPWSGGLIEKVGQRLDHLETQAFLTSLFDVDRFSHLALHVATPFVWKRPIGASFGTLR